MCARAGDESSGSEERIVVVNGMVAVLVDDEGIDMEFTIVVVGGLVDKGLQVT